MSLHTQSPYELTRFGWQTCRPTMEWFPGSGDVITITSGVQYLFTVPAFPGDAFDKATFFTDSSTSQATDANSELLFSLYDKAETELVEGATPATYARLTVSASAGESWAWPASQPKTLTFSSYGISDTFANLYAIGLLAVYASGSLKLKGVTLDAFLAYGRGHDGQNGGSIGMPIGMKARTIIHNATGLNASPATVTPNNGSSERAKLAFATAGDYPT